MQEPLAIFCIYAEKRQRAFYRPLERKKSWFGTKAKLFIIKIVVSEGCCFYSMHFRPCRTSSGGFWGGMPADLDFIWMTEIALILKYFSK